MKKVSARTFKSQCLTFIEEVRTTRQPILITQGGRPLVKLVALEATPKQFLGRLEGVVKIVGDLESPLEPASSWQATRSLPKKSHGSRLR
jgi:prevent-host-death family protein